MRIARFVLKLVALGLMAAAAICAVIAYWDKLTELACQTKNKIQSGATRRVEYADYEE